MITLVDTKVYRDTEYTYKCIQMPHTSRTLIHQMLPQLSLGTTVLHRDGGHINYTNTHGGLIGQHLIQKKERVCKT